jgi:hypothetical protein
VRAQEDGEDEMEFKVVGASNAARTAAALTRNPEKLTFCQACELTYFLLR